MGKQQKNISIAAIVLALIGVCGYLWPVPAQEMPTRILLENKGGDMAFSHVVHFRNYDIGCQECHHEGGDMSSPMDCGSCHPVTFSEPFKEEHQSHFSEQWQCVRCHHSEFKKLHFDHAMHEDFTPDCTDCHHTADIEEEPQSCSNCHQKEEGNIINLKQAGHERCATCHEDMFAEGLEGCSHCHEEEDMTTFESGYRNCADCHDNTSPEELIPSRTNAFHGQCMGCHEKRKAGPFGDKNCKTCHVR